MSFFGTASAVIRILDWAKDKWENAKKLFKQWNRRRIARSIRQSIDSGDKPAVGSRVRAVLKKRRDRADSD